MQQSIVLLSHMNKAMKCCASNVTAWKRALIAATSLLGLLSAVGSAFETPPRLSTAAGSLPPPRAGRDASRRLCGGGNVRLVLLSAAAGRQKFAAGRRFPSEAYGENATISARGVDSGPKAKAPIRPTERAEPLRIVAACVLCLLAGATAFCPASAAAAMAALDAEPLSFAGLLPPPRTLAPLASAAALLALLSLPLRPISLFRPVLVASARCIGQLSLLGGVVLSTLFRSNTASTILPYVSALAVVAASESASRVRFDTPRFRLDALAALLIGCGSALAAAALAILRPRPWFDAPTIVPLAGMLLGNAVSALALCADSLLGDLRENADRVELLLARGATAGEASAPSVRGALRTALTPMINSLSVCGLVHIPGVMTGSILAGMGAGEAGRSQALVMMLIASSTVGTVLAVSNFLLRDVMDFGSDRVLSDRIRPAGKGEVMATKTSIFYQAKHFISAPLSMFKLFFGNNDQVESDSVGISRMEGASNLVRAKALGEVEIFMASDASMNSRSSSQETEAVLSAKSISVPYTNRSVSFCLDKSNKLAIMGRSGVGKTQLLRRLALLEVSSNEEGANLALFGHAAPGPRGACAWRQRVSWVPQHRPTLPGTPHGLYEDIVRLRAQCGMERWMSPFEFASDWGLDASTFQRPWSSLSGGEAQRASLAIAMALRPDVLLLDEPTGACDTETTERMEKSLNDFCSLGGCVVIVTHSREQALRFCTHTLELD